MSPHVPSDDRLAVHATGQALLLNPLTNKGTAFPPEEREALHLEGLLPPVVSTMEQQLDRQGNNAFVFPGIGLGIRVGRVRRVTGGLFLDAARTLANQVTREDLEQGAVYPALTRIRACSHAVACAVIRRAVAEGYAAPPRITPDLEDTVIRAMWMPQYRPIRYEPATVNQEERVVCQTTPATT